MKSNELNLMVGDWVIGESGNYEQIAGIIGRAVYTKQCSILISLDWQSSSIQPIPLSPEVMEKIESISKNENRGTRYGFLDGYYNIDRDTGLVAIFEDDGLLYIYTYEYSHEQFQLVSTFEHLHQLQQLIRLFTNKEIEVK